MRVVRQIRLSAYAGVIGVCLIGPECVNAQDALLTTPAWTIGLQSSRHPPTPISGSLVTTETTSRPRALVPLYSSLVLLQALDVHSTRRGLSAGGREMNPVMEPVVTNRAAFIAVKAAVTAGLVLASERLWRTKNRKAAVLLAVFTNVGLAAVVAHNYRAVR